MEFFIDLAHYGFLQKAFITAVVVGAVSGAIGCFIVLRGLALLGDAISHAVLPGVALSYLFGVSYFLGAFVFGILTALGIGFIQQHSRIKADSAIGIVFTAFFALGVILIAKAQSATDLTQILFGNVLAVTRENMWTTIMIGALVLLILGIFYRQFVLSTFDPTLAAVSGLPVRLLHYTLMVLLTLVTVAALQTVGVIMVVALLITPAATAYLLTNRLPIMIAISSGIGMFSAAAGLYMSFQYNVSSGAAIVLVAAVLFVLAFLLAPKQGALVRWFRQQRMAGSQPHMQVSARED